MAPGPTGRQNREFGPEPGCRTPIAYTAFAPTKEFADELRQALVDHLATNLVRGVTHGEGRKLAIATTQKQYQFSKPVIGGCYDPPGTIFAMADMVLE